MTQEITEACDPGQAVCNGARSQGVSLGWANGIQGRRAGRVKQRFLHYKSGGQHSDSDAASSTKRKLYICFVGFKKAFDLVPHCTLWQVLEMRGMKGKVLDSLKTMYAADKACVVTAEGPTGLFECGIGVKARVPSKRFALS